MRVGPSVLVVILFIDASCSRDHGRTKVLPKSNTSASSQPATSSEFGADAPDASTRVPAQIPNDLPWAKPVEEYVSRLRAASHAADATEFAQLLTYPLRVNTTSRCTAVIPSAAVFIAHFDEIVRGRVDAALKAPSVDCHATWQGVSFGTGSIWIDPFDEDRPKVSAFNSDSWRIGGLPCDGEPEALVPQWLAGTWQVTSVAIIQGGQLTPRAPTTWIGKSIDIDLRGRTATSRLNDSSGKQCAIERFASRSSDGPQELGAAFAGLTDEDKTQFLDLKCCEAEGRHVERVEVIDRTALAIVGDDKYLLVLRRASAATPGSIEGKQKIVGCGESHVECPAGQVCTASRRPGGTIVESCVGVD